MTLALTSETSRRTSAMPSKLYPHAHLLAPMLAVAVCLTAAWPWPVQAQSKHYSQICEYDSGQNCVTPENSRLLLPIGKQISVAARGAGAQFVNSVSPAQGSGVSAAITQRGTNEFKTRVTVASSATRGTTSINTTYPVVGAGPQIRIRKVLNPQITNIAQLPMSGPEHVAQRPTCNAQFTFDVTYHGSNLGQSSALNASCKDCPPNTTVQVLGSQANQMTVRYGFNTVNPTLKFQLRVRDNNDPKAYWGGASRYIRLSMPPGC
jgi:hypothetical protein